MTPSFQCITFYQNWIRLLVFLLIFQFLLSSAVLIDYPPQTCHSCISYVLPNRFPGSSDGKESAYNAGDPNLILGLGRCPGEGKGNSLQYSCLKNPMDRGAWRAIVHGVTWLSDWIRRSTLRISFVLISVFDSIPDIGLKRLGMHTRVHGTCLWWFDYDLEYS